jgi:hypothetical protein
MSISPPKPPIISISPPLSPLITLQSPELLQHLFPHLTITPKAPKQHSSSPIHAQVILDSSRFSPLTIEQLETLINFHNKNYDYSLNPHIFENLQESKDEITTFIYNFFEETECSWVFKDPTGIHFTMIYGKIFKDIPYLILLDSFGESGPYVKDIIEELISIEGFEEQNVEILILGPQRQQDTYSCGLFTFNDLRFVSKNPTALEDILESGELSSSENLPYCKIITFPPLELLIGLQSRSTLELLKQIHGEHSEELDLLEQSIDSYSKKLLHSSKKTEQLFLKTTNLFIYQQWKSVNAILTSYFTR